MKQRNLEVLWQTCLLGRNLIVTTEKMYIEEDLGALNVVHIVQTNNAIACAIVAFEYGLPLRKLPDQ